MLDNGITLTRKRSDGLNLVNSGEEIAVDGVELDGSFGCEASLKHLDIAILVAFSILVIVVGALRPVLDDLSETEESVTERIEAKGDSTHLPISTLEVATAERALAGTGHPSREAVLAAEVGCSRESSVGLSLKREGQSHRKWSGGVGRSALVHRYKMRATHKDSILEEV